MASSKSAREVGLLRQIVENLAARSVPEGLHTVETLRAFGMDRAKFIEGEMKGILSPGAEPFRLFSEAMLERSPRMERGVAFPAYQEEIFRHLVPDYIGRSPNTVGEPDVLALRVRLEGWFDSRTPTRSIFVPCMLSPAESPKVQVGPVSFQFVDDVTKSESYQGIGAIERYPLDSLLHEMRNEQALWLATVEVIGCDKDRAQEVGELAVDLAIVAFQLSAPYLGTKTMSRLDARRGPTHKQTLTLVEGCYAADMLNKAPGLSIGQGYLGKITTDAAPLFAAVGKCVSSFLTGMYRLPQLEQAWCDAAYWLHEGLAESLDSIAVAKLETSLEVLLRAENSRGSERRIMVALDAFYGLSAEDPVMPHAQFTARQFAKGFVRDRSRVLHGTCSTLNTRLTSSRAELENFAITLIRSSALELDGYYSSASPRDDMDAFAKWVKSRREKATSS